ncbi:hypothetical protein BGI32_05945 [Snodgrassella alvi]|uniref:Uncharacterized protein n=1 Tax=Snodgrassella alvi TaxID=1196083 RepID=A0A2N9WTP1_9NEIS|nr:hypothetical protein [Snodgrassella alvi]PIT15046.1 hypothetical protein BGI32_05945 [Snodgrassella alvi]
MKKLLIILLLLPSLAIAKDYKTIISGKKLTYKGENCAGVAFSSNGLYAFIYAEQGAKCLPNLSLRVKWLNNNTVMLVERNKTAENAPQVIVMQFKSIKKNKTTVKNIWAGWGDQPDQIEKYTIK